MDPVTKAIIDVLDDPSKINPLDVMKKVNCFYRDPLRKQMIGWVNNRLVMKELSFHSIYMLNLILVPLDM